MSGERAPTSTVSAPTSESIESALAVLAYSNVAVDTVPERRGDVDRSLVGLAVKRAQYALELALDDGAAETGMTMKRLAILREIKAHPGASNAVLAKLVFVTPQAFGQHINRLVEDGLVARRPGGGRRRILVVTGAGERVFAQGYATVRSICDAAFQDVAADQFGPFVATLLRVEARCFESRAMRRHALLRQRLSEA